MARKTKEIFGEPKAPRKNARKVKTRRTKGTRGPRKITRALTDRSGGDTVTVTIPKAMAFSLGVLIGQAQANQ